MNKINPKKLLNSKWTAVAPVKKEKHFIVKVLKFDEEGEVTVCKIEAVMYRRPVSIQWQDLRDDSRWIHGWK